MTLPMIDEPATDDADTTPYERRGLYAVAVSEVPSADVEGRRAASVWGVIWRILAVVALLCVMSAAQAVYYAMVDTRNASPGLLGFAGVTWDTWWGFVILLIVFAVGGLAPVIVAFLTAAAGAGRRFTPVMAACVVCMPLVWAIIPGNAVGVSLWWYECWQSGVCSYFDTSQGILGILPGVAVSVAGVLLTVALWLTVGRATRRESGRETVLGRVLYMLSPAVGSIVLVVNRMVPVGVQTVFAVFLLVLMLGEIVPQRAGGRGVRHPQAGFGVLAVAVRDHHHMGGPVLHHDGRRADLRTLGRDHPAGGVGVQPSWRSQLPGGVGVISRRAPAPGMSPASMPCATSNSTSARSARYTAARAPSRVIASGGAPRTAPHRRWYRSARLSSRLRTWSGCLAYEAWNMADSRKLTGLSDSHTPAVLCTYPRMPTVNHWSSSQNSPKSRDMRWKASGTLQAFSHTPTHRSR